MRIFLPDTNKHYWLASGLDHVESSANFLINSVELCQNDSIDSARIVLTNCEVNKTLVELCKLVNRVVSYESLSYEQNNIRRVQVN